MVRFRSSPELRNRSAKPASGKDMKYNKKQAKDQDKTDKERAENEDPRGVGRNKHR